MKRKNFSEIFSEYLEEEDPLTKIVRMEVIETNKSRKNVNNVNKAVSNPKTHYNYEHKEYNLNDLKHWKRSGN